MYSTKLFLVLVLIIIAGKTDCLIVVQEKSIDLNGVHWKMDVVKDTCSYTSVTYLIVQKDESQIAKHALPNADEVQNFVVRSLKTSNESFVLDLEYGTVNDYSSSFYFEIINDSLFYTKSIFRISNSDSEDLEIIDRKYRLGIRDFNLEDYLLN